MQCVGVKQVEAGDQSEEAQQSEPMLTFEGLALLKKKKGGGEWAQEGIGDNSTHLITPLPRIRDN